MADFSLVMGKMNSFIDKVSVWYFTLYPTLLLNQAKKVSGRWSQVSLSKRPVSFLLDGSFVTGEQNVKIAGGEDVVGIILL